MTGTIGDVAIVTGASGGMGRAIAMALAAQGWALILCDLRAEPLEALKQSLPADADVATVAGDVTAPDLSTRILSAIGGRKIGAFVHTAGLSPSMGDGERVFAVNFTATKALTEALLPQMADGGIAILFASNSAYMIARAPFGGAVAKVLKGKRSLIARLMLRSPRTAYPLSKRAVQLYAASMAPAFGAVGARIVSLSPGIIDTDMARREQSVEPAMAKLLAHTPLGRSGRADEIASVVAFLASPAASYISGTDILIDGGSVAATNHAGGPTKLK